MTIVVSKDTEGLFRHKITFPEGEGVTYTDVPKPTGEGSAPDPHGYFDASLAACKTLTVTLYARQRKYPLESIDVAVEHDDSQERQGHYKLRTVLTLHGNLTDEQRADLLRVAGKCPVHKLMTEVEISIDTELAART